MKKCLFLIPTAYNDGKPVSPEIIDQILDQLFAKFGPYSIDGTTEGLWQLEDGKIVKDQSLKIWIVLSEDKVPRLEKTIANFAKILKQEAICLVVTDCDMKLIEPE